MHGNSLKQTIVSCIAATYLFVALGINFLHTCEISNHKNVDLPLEYVAHSDGEHSSLHRGKSVDHEDSSSSNSHTRHYCPACKFLAGNQSDCIGFEQVPFLTEVDHGILPSKTLPCNASSISAEQIRAPPLSIA